MRRRRSKSISKVYIDSRRERRRRKRSRRRIRREGITRIKKTNGEWEDSKQPNERKGNAVYWWTKEREEKK
jgi:hypothetical protein